MKKKYWLFQVRISITKSPIRSVFLEVVEETDSDYIPDVKGDGGVIATNVFLELVKRSKFEKHRTAKMSVEVLTGPTRITKARYDKLIDQMRLSNFR